MNNLRAQCTKLYELAFPGEPVAFTKALFDRYFPDCIRTLTENGQPVAMLFSIPYPLLSNGNVTEAHYLYGVATHPDHRGKGLAKKLLAAEAALYPVFLRPMSAELFDFYAKAGFTPISPLTHAEGSASAPNGDERLLSSAEYLALRNALTPSPACCPTTDFLSLYKIGGGFVSSGTNTVALFERQDDSIWFKEYWGEPDLAPRLAAFLGGKRFSLRRYDPNGTPFGMACGVPAETAFLAALD